MDEEQRAKAATQFHTWIADLAAEVGAGWMSTTHAWTGECREDGVLVPHPEDELGFSVIPPYRVGSVGVDFPDGFVVQQLFYSAPRDRYAVAETVWGKEPEPSAAYPIGKSAPEGTAPLR